MKEYLVFLCWICFCVICEICGKMSSFCETKKHNLIVQMTNKIKKKTDTFTRSQFESIDFSSSGIFHACWQIEFVSFGCITCCVLLIVFCESYENQINHVLYREAPGFFIGKNFIYRMFQNLSWDKLSKLHRMELPYCQHWSNGELLMRMTKVQRRKQLED